MLTRFLIPLAGLVLLTFQTFAKPKSESYLQIKQRYAEIQTNLKNHHYITQRFTDARFGEEVVTGYFKNNRIELIVSETYGEIGKIRHEYYFDKNGELIIASNQLFKYDEGDTNINLVKVNENRYYYTQKRLVKWMNERNQLLNIHHPDALPRSRYMLGKSIMLTAKLKERRNDEVIGQYQQNSNAPQFERGQHAECYQSGS
ncbi:MAG: hypothetical protein MUF45_12750 [Spirosomaceae bacterium]|jgi:hypothetical protein|nr:hypothetical protein [Spirosomataceae bacterium]